MINAGCVYSIEVVNGRHPGSSPSNPVRFMDRFKAHMRAKHLAYRTEKIYCLWVLDFIRFHGRRHPEDMGAAFVCGVFP